MPDQFAKWPQKLIAFAVSSCFAGSAYANPSGASVVAGGATFASSGNTLTVTNTPGSVINWAQFSIAKDEATRFIQQNAQSAVLNRVMGQDPSQILGTLTSNGRVFLINPNGITFGMGSVIDVGGLVASTLNLSNQDFLAGRNNFVATPGAGKLLNQGTLSARNGGSIYLVASSVENSGVITTPAGEVILAAGKSANLVDSANPDIRVEITAPDNQALNVGTIVGRNVGIYGGLIRHSGTVNANAAVVGDGGKIVFKAVGDVTLDGSSVTGVSGANGGTITAQSDTGTTLVSGVVSATGTAGKGGTVKLLGEQVGLADHATVDASGATGGGTVLIGGDFHGANPAVQNATATYFGADALVKADAIDTGDGGRVIVWANDATRAYGQISARGGANSGDGGFVETSGKAWLDFRASVDTRAPFGNTGTLLLDPTTITISNNPTSGGTCFYGGPCFTLVGNPASANLQASDLTSALVGSNVTVSTASAGAGAGDINVNAVVSYISSNTLALNADHDIVISQKIQNGGSGAINLTATNSIKVQDAFVSTLTGTMTVNAANLNVTSTSTPTYLYSGGLQTIHITGAISLQAAGAGSGNSASIYSDGGQNISASQITLTGGAGGSGGTNNEAYISATNGNQAITASTVTVNGGAGDFNDAYIATGSSESTQSINASQITVTGGSAGTFNGARISASGAQTITGSPNITLTGGAGEANDAYIDANSQNITAGQITATGASAGGASEGTVGSLVGIFSYIGAQNITATQISLTGGAGGDHNAAVINSAEGMQTISGNPTIQLNGGASGSFNHAEISSSYGGQIITAGAISITGGAGGIANSARIYASGDSGTQTVNATGITLTGGAGGGAEGASQINSSGNYAMLRGNASQEITVGAGGITATGGGGAGADNFAQVRQGQVSLTPATPGTHQTITVNNGGTIALQGGSTSFVSTPNGDGSFGRIRGEGDTQTINFTSGGAINLTGGTLGTNNDAGIMTSTAGQQTITGSPSVSMTGGASGGASGNGNFARIYAGVGQQALTLGATTMNGAAGGVDNYAAILAQNQNITVNGNLSMTGSSGATATGAAGTRIGAPSDYATSLTLVVHGGITLNGGATTNNGSAIGSSPSSATPQTDDLTISADTDITLNGGSAAGTRIGQPSGLLLGDGTINVTAGGNIALNGNATTRGAIRTLGNMIVNATNNISVQDSTITAGGTENISAGNNLSVTANLNSSLIEATAGGLQTISAKGIAVQGAAAGTGFNALIVGNAGQNITAGANGITLTGGAGGTDNWAGIHQFGAGSNQMITVNGGGTVSLNGGGGTNNSAVIQNEGLAQSISFTAVGSALTAQGGSGAGGHNHAGVGNEGAGAATQTISFANGGAINLTGGTNGIDNGAGIEAVTGNQTISGNPDIALTGGASGGVAVNSNGASINLKLGTGGVQTITAHNLLLQGGAGGIENGATIGADTSIISATANVTLTGGAGTDAIAAIGSSKSDVNITLNAAGPVTLTGGSGAYTNYGAFAAIGAVGGFNADVTVNGQSSVTLNKGTGQNANAWIGSDTGGGTLILKSGLGGAGDFALNDGLIKTTGTASIVAGGTGALTQSSTATSVTAMGGVGFGGASIGTAANPIVFEAGGSNVSATATSGGIFLKQASGDLLASTYALNAAGAGQTISLATGNGTISVDSVGGLTGDDSLVLTANGATSDILLNSGPVNVAGATLTAGRNIALAVALNANAGNVALNAGGQISQTAAGTINTTGTLTGSAGTAETLNQNNTIANLGAFTSNGLTVNDTAGGLNVTGAVNGGTGAVSLTTAGGALALGASNVSGAGVALQGAGVTSAAGSTVNAGAGDILVNGGAGAINLAGALTTTSNTATAVTVRNASTVALGNVTTGGTGTTTLGVGSDITGAVTQSGVISTGTLTGSTTNSVTLAGNNTVANLGAFTSNGLTVNDTVGGLNVTGAVNGGTGAVSMTTAGGALDINNTVSGNGISLSGSTISINHAEVNSTADVTVNGGTLNVYGGNNPNQHAILSAAHNLTANLTGDLNVIAGNASNSFAKISGGPGTGFSFTVHGNINLTGGTGVPPGSVTGSYALIVGDPDVTINMTGGTASSINFSAGSDPATDYARIHAISPNTIAITFDPPNAHGITGDVVPSGFYVGPGDGVPATPGHGLNIVPPQQIEGNLPLLRTDPDANLAFNTLDNATNTAASGGGGSGTDTEEKKKEQAQQGSSAQGDKARSAALPSCK